MLEPGAVGCLIGCGLRLGLLVLAAALVVVFALDWNRWLGGRANQSTDDATLQSNMTPLAAKVPGSIRAVPVGDFQSVRRGDLLLEIADDDLHQQVAQAEVNVTVAQAAVPNLQSQRMLQAANIRAAEAVVAATAANVVNYYLEAQRQRTLLATYGIAVST